MPTPLDDAARSPDPAVCPFLRLEAEGLMAAPAPMPDGAHRCVAIGEPAPQSFRQQQLVCLQPAHGNCPRYLRGALGTPAPAANVAAQPRVPRATLASLLFLVLAAGISFGFVFQRGSLDLVAAVPTPEPSTAVVATASPAPTGEPTPVPETPAPSATSEPNATGAPATPAPTSAVTPSPAPTARPTATPASTSDRYASLTPCPDRPDCWIYVVQRGNNLVSIANYYGHPLATILAWNTWITDPANIRAGDEIRMPPPTR